MRLLDSVRRRINAHAYRYENAPTLPTIPDRDGAHEHRLDMEHLQHLTEQILGECGRLAAREPYAAATLFAHMLTDLRTPFEAAAS